jgi:cysteine-rich repeat protein
MHGAAQATLVSDLGGPLGFGTMTLPRDDDSVFAEVDITPAFPSGLVFFGTTATRIFVNNNGNLTFGAPVATFTPTAFAPGAPQPMIAAWWGDVDTRRVPDATPAAAAENLVYYAVEPSRVVVTWILVDYFARHGDLRNSFQIVLTPAPSEPAGTLDIEFRYNRCEWTTGDASGGRDGFGGEPAAAGVDQGPAAVNDAGMMDGGAPSTPGYLTLPGSRSMAVLALCTTSNVADRGVWRIRARGESIVPMCGNFLVDVGEECDDGNASPRDGCDGTCLAEGCGNGRVEGGEACDDGDTVAGDGCSPSCMIELPDAGPPRPDAGPDVVRIGGGGCVCGVDGGARPLGPPWVLALIAIGGLYRGRQRRSGGRRSRRR